MGAGRAIATGLVAGAAMAGIQYLVAKAYEALVGIDTVGKIAGLGAVHLVVGGAAAGGAYATSRAGMPHEVASTAAATVAVAIANARLYQAEREQHRRLQASQTRLVQAKGLRP